MIESAENIAAYLERERPAMPRLLLEVAVLGAYNRAYFSAGRAARLLDLPVAQFLEMASFEGFSVINTPPGELVEEIRSALATGGPDA